MSDQGNHCSELQDRVAGGKAGGTLAPPLAAPGVIFDKKDHLPPRSGPTVSRQLLSTRVSSRLDFARWLELLRVS